MIKYFIILFIALGIILFPLSIFTIKYQCTGQEIFPVFYGSPFIYKSTSLATSLAYDYYLSGFLGCWAFWFLLIGLISYTSDRFILNENQILNFIYKGTTGLLIIISILSIYITIQTSTGSNIEWHADITKRAKEWGMHCDGEFKFLAN